MVAQGRKRTSQRFCQSIYSKHRRPDIIASRLHSAARFGTREIGVESLESRTLMSLVGVVLGDPRMTFNSTGVTNYNATSGALDVTATPQLFVNGTDLGTFNAPNGLAIHCVVNNSGVLTGGVSGDDLVISGDLDSDDDGDVDYSGVLLTGEITGFGFLEAGITDLYDMRFTVSGGLMASLYAGRDIGVTFDSENSTFNDSFATDFTGGAKGTLGSIPQQVGRLSGRKFSDLTGNGPSADDTGLGGTTIQLIKDANNNNVNDDAIFATTVTATGTGAYSFENLAPGLYFVQEVVPTGYAQTGPVGSGVYVVNVTPGSDTQNRDFANVQLGRIEGKKYKDITGNGLTPDDTPLDGTTIQLYKDANNNSVNDDALFASTITAAGTGAYSFENLQPGRYFVKEVIPSGYFRTTPNPIDTYTIVVTPGSSTTDQNFANAQFAGLSGKKFLDKTGNGLSNDDTGLAGTTIRLFRDANNDGQLTAADGAAAQTTVTGSGGAYSFNNLVPGRYFIQEVISTGYVRTAPALSDTYTVVLTSGQNSSGFDFANFKKDDCLDDISNIKYYFNNYQIPDLRGNTSQGGRVKVTFTVLPGHSATVWLVSYAAPGPTFDASQASQQTIFQSSGGTFGPGNYSLMVLLPKSYYQVDFICGAPISQFGPAGSGIFYGAQGRLISADNGGTNSCVDDLTAAPSYWASASGQTLIKKLNATSIDTNPTNLATWLATQFPRIYGSSSVNSMVGKRNTNVAALMSSLFSNTAKTLDTSVLAAALSAYVTKSSTVGTSAALVQSYGIQVNSNGLSASIFNVGANGTAFGVANNTNRTVLQLLQGVNAQSTTSGNLYNGSNSLRTMAQNIFGGVNNNGGMA